MTTTRKRSTKRKLWSVSRIRHPQYPEHGTLRVTELRPGGSLYYVWMKDGKQRMATMRCTRADLGTTHKKQEEAARARACKMIEQRATGKACDSTPAASGATPTLGDLTQAYTERGFYGRTARYQKEQSRKVRRVAAFLGEERAVTSLRPSDVKQYGAARLTQGVRQRTARGELMAVKIACNWAVGEGLLDANPFAKIKLDRVQQQPRRPVASPERYRKLKAVADQIAPPLTVLLDLAWATGHRVGAILSLRWDDISFDATEAAPRGTIRWRAEADKTRREHTLPMNTTAHAALQRWRKLHPGIGGSWLFSAPKNPRKLLSRSVARHWLARAEELAGLEHIQGGAWHMFRRSWPTQRKHLPLKDVAAAGGWNDTATMLRCYQHADPETTLAVIEHSA